MTVRICNESRLAKLQLEEAKKLYIDGAFDEVTGGEELERRETPPGLPCDILL